MLSCYSPIVFDERVSFGFNASSHCLAHLFVALFVCRLTYNQYAITHAYNAANTHTKGSDRVRWSQKMTLSSKSLKCCIQKAALIHPKCFTKSVFRHAEKEAQVELNLTIILHWIEYTLKGPFILRYNCIALPQCTLLHRTWDVSTLRCCMKVKLILT